MTRKEINETEISCLEDIVEKFNKINKEDGYNPCFALVKSYLELRKSYRKEYNQEGFKSEYWASEI